MFFESTHNIEGQALSIHLYIFLATTILVSQNEQQINVILKQTNNNKKRGVTHKIKVKFIVEQQTPHIQQTGQGKTNNVDKTKSKETKTPFLWPCPPIQKLVYGTTKVHT